MKFGFSYNRYTKNQQLQADAAGDYGLRTEPDRHRKRRKCRRSIHEHAPWPLHQLFSAAVHGDPALCQPDYVGVCQRQLEGEPRLSLQLGLRYDALPHAWERNNASRELRSLAIHQQPRALVYDNAGRYRPDQPWSSDACPGLVGASYYLNGMVTPGTNGVPHGVVTNDYNTWQPRVGFAYDLFGNGRTVLRGGFGTFYERLQGNDIYGLSNSNLPYEYTPLAGSVYFSAPTCSWESTASTANPANCGSPTALPIYPAGLTSLDTTYKAPRRCHVQSRRAT
jgi:hypothetical protein